MNSSKHKTLWPLYESARRAHLLKPLVFCSTPWCPHPSDLLVSFATVGLTPVFDETQKLSAYFGGEARSNRMSPDRNPSGKHLNRGLYPCLVERTLFPETIHVHAKIRFMAKSARINPSVVAATSLPLCGACWATQLVSWSLPMGH